jgi:hypothetical protein
MSGDRKSDTFERLATVAAEANIVDAVAELPNSKLVNWLQDQTDAYVAWAGDKWTDEGLAAWVASRQTEMNAALRADVAVVTGAVPQRSEVEAPDREAILAAAEALERAKERDEEVSPAHMATLFMALMQRRGPYALAFERELNAYHRLTGGKGDSEGQSAHLASHKDELRPLFRADLAAIIREAREAS